MNEIAMLLKAVEILDAAIEKLKGPVSWNAMPDERRGMIADMIHRAHDAVHVVKGEPRNATFCQRERPCAECGMLPAYHDDEVCPK